jgi:hypothetical protein
MSFVSRVFVVSVPARAEPDSRLLLALFPRYLRRFSLPQSFLIGFALHPSPSSMMPEVKRSDLETYQPRSSSAALKKFGITLYLHDLQTATFTFNIFRVLIRPCHASGGPGSLPDPPMWNLRWTKCHCERFSTQHFCLLSQYHSSNAPLFIHNRRCITLPFDSVIKRHILRNGQSQ